MVHSYCHVFLSIFSEGVDVYTTTFPQMLSKCLIGVATLLICFAVSYDQQHFLNEKELNRQIDQQKATIMRSRSRFWQNVKHAIIFVIR